MLLVFSANSVASVVSLLLGWGQGPGCADLPNFLIPKHWRNMIYPPLRPHAASTRYPKWLL